MLGSDLGTERERTFWKSQVSFILMWWEWSRSTEDRESCLEKEGWDENLASSFFPSSVSERAHRRGWLLAGLKHRVRGHGRGQP